jgi:energy-coupling factor transporter ATP-binding protein EcfA2
MNETKIAGNLYKISTYIGETPYQTKIVDNELNMPFEELASIITTTSWSPGTFRYVKDYKTKKGELITGKYRSNDTFNSLNLMVFDIDKNLTIVDAIKILNKLGLRYMVLPTKSHQKQKGDELPCDRFRIVIALSRKITSKDEYFLLWKYFSIYFNVDPSCKDVARYYNRSIELAAQGGGSCIEVDQILSELKNKKTDGKAKPTSILNKSKNLGQLSKKTKDFIENGNLPDENWHDRYFLATTDMREQGYSIEEAREMLTLASKNELGHLDETDENQLTDIYSRRNRYPPRVAQDGNATQLSILMSIANDIELYQSEEGEAYLATDEIGVVYHVESCSARNMIVDKFYQKTNSLPNTQIVDTVLQHLCYHAQKKPKVSINYRVARDKQTVIIDRGSKENAFIVVTENGWSLTPEVGLKFVRHQNMKELPIPLVNGNIHDLRPFINLGSDSDFILLISFIVGCFFKSKQYPIAVFQGPQGSGKSTLSEILKMLIDPGVPSLRSLPKSEGDLFIAARHSHLICFDNLSGIKIDISDALCKISTGGAIAGRKYYSNADEYFIQVCRPFVINGIDDLIYRPDLADRALVFHLPKITESSRALDSKIQSDLLDVLPSIFGSILDGVSSGLKNLSKVTLKEKIRLADFGEIACASLIAYGYAQDQVYQCLQSNRHDLGIDTIESNPIGRALVKFMSDKTEWKGKPSELSTIVKNALDYEGTSYYHKTPSAISREINRIIPELKHKDITVDHVRTSKTRFLIIKNMSSLPSLPPPPPGWSKVNQDEQ